MAASWEVKEGPVLDVLRSMPSASVHSSITSPPYFGLRAYEGDQVVDWPAVDYYPMPGLDAYMPPITIPAGPAALGGESDPLAYIGHLVAVFREVRRVLRGDGLLWLNLGDSFAGSGGAGGDYAAAGLREGQRRYTGTNRLMALGEAFDGSRRPQSGLKPKDRIGIPERAALALQADGWYWRSSAPWVKRNGMPDSAADRPGSAVEWVHLLAKGRRPFYDVHAVELPASEEYAAHVRARRPDQVLGAGFEIRGGLHKQAPSSTRRRRNSDWWFDSLRRADAAGPVGGVPGPDGEIIAFDCTVASFPGAHFATWPPALVEPMILASTSARGCCPVCGAGWVRVVARSGGKTDNDPPKAIELSKTGKSNNGIGSSTLSIGGAGHGGAWAENGTKIETIDWRPSCGCIKEYQYAATAPAVVLDPFSGSGTTGAVALSLGRRYIGIELSSEYAAMSRERIGGAQPALFGL